MDYRSSELTRLTAVGVGLILVLMVWFVFGQTIQYGFINFDDPGYVYANPAVTNGLTAESVQWAFTHRHGGNWHPLTSLSHMLDCQLFGLNPAGPHLINIILHLVTTLLLFSVLRQMTGFFWRSAVVAAMFAIHPLRVESVVWIAERKDVLSGLFFMLTLRAYIHYVRRVFSLRRYLLVVLVFLPGLLSKPMLVTLPFILLLMDYWPLKRMNSSSERFVLLRYLIAEKIPLFLFSALVCVSTVWAQEHALAKIEVPFLYRICNAAVSYLIYLKQFIYPFDLALVYPHPGCRVAFWQAGSAMLLLAGVSILAWAGRKTRPWFLMGWMWYVGMLVPVIGLIQVGVQAHADRYTYLPHIGLCFLFVWAVAEQPVFQRCRRSVWYISITAVLITLMLIARAQAAFWRSDIVLWSHTLACTENNTTALVNLGAALFAEGKGSAAETCFAKALEIDSGDVDALYNLGYAFVSRGVFDEGIIHLQNALRLDPDYFDAHKALGAALILQGRLDEGIGHSVQALQLRPSDAGTLRNLEVARTLAGEKQKISEKGSVPVPAAHPGD